MIYNFRLISKYLFSFQRELDENLLQFLIHVVDAKLFEAVPLKDFESVNIENSDGDIILLACHGSVHRLS